MSRAASCLQPARDQFPWQQYVHPAVGLHPARHRFRVIAVAKEKISAQRSADRATDILGNEETAKFVLGLCGVGVGYRSDDEDGCAEGVDPAIDGHARPGREWHTFGAGTAE